MTLYTAIYSFFTNYIFTSELNNYSLEIMGQNTSMSVWLSHTATIVTLVLLVVALALAVKYIFKVIYNAFRSL